MASLSIDIEPCIAFLKYADAPQLEKLKVKFALWDDIVELCKALTSKGLVLQEIEVGFECEMYLAELKTVINCLSQVSREVHLNVFWHDPDKEDFKQGVNDFLRANKKDYEL